MSESLEDAALDAAKKIAAPYIAKAEQAVPALISSLVSIALSKGKDGVADLPAPVQPILQAVLDTVDAHKDAIAGVAQEKLVSIVNLTAAGQEEAARLVYLSTAATNDDRFAAQDDASAATRDEVEKRSKAWQKIKAWALDVAEAVAKAAILAAI